MRKIIDLLFPYLLLLTFLIKNLNCDVNTNLLSYQKDDARTSLENSNSSNILNEEKSYITNLNSVDKNKKLKNDKKLLNNLLYDYNKNNTYEITAENAENGKNKNLYEEKNSGEENGKIDSSFMFINTHSTTNGNIKVGESEKDHKLCNEEMVKENCRKEHNEKADNETFLNKNNIIRLNNLKLENQQPIKHVYVNQHSKKKFAENKLEESSCYNSNTCDKIIRPNLKKKIRQKEKSDSLYEVYKTNYNNNKTKRQIDVGRDVNLPFLENFENDFKDNHYFDPKKYIEIKYPIHNNTEQKMNKYSKMSKDVIGKKMSPKFLLNDRHVNFITYNDNKNRNLNDESDDINDSDLLYILEDGYKPNDNKKKKFSNAIRKKPISDEHYRPFDLRDALIDDANDDNKHIEVDNGEKSNIEDEDHVKEKVKNSKENLSLKYLGLGYDIIMGNPEGDPILNIDPGFKGPILEIEHEEISYNNRNNNSKMIPWIIPKQACNQSKYAEEIKNLEQYISELLSDIKINFPLNMPYYFSASLGFKNTQIKLKLQNQIIFIKKIYCSKYYAGIPVLSSWKYTDHFKNALDLLPSTFEGLKEDSSCNYKNYLNKMNNIPECEKNVNKWMIFFKIYGTHVVYEAYLGGKIILKMNVDKNKYNSMKQNKLSMKLIFDFYLNKMGLSTNYNKKTQTIQENFNISKHISIFGGNPDLNVEDSSFFSNWLNSIEKNPMPIRSKLMPFSFFMSDRNKIKAYNDALTFYGLSYGAQIINQEKYSNGIFSIDKYLENCTQKLYAGPPPGLLECPLKSSIIMGLSMNLNFFKNKKLSNTIGMDSCEQIKESCSSNGFKHDNLDTRIWALCSSDPLKLITQVIQQGENSKVTAECPQDMAILFGFALMKGIGPTSANHVDIYPCRTGQTSCSAILQNDKLKQSMVYISCVDKKINGLEKIETFSKVKNMGYVVERNFNADGFLKFSCPDKTALIFGFAIEFHTNFPITRNNFLFCSKGTNSCEIKGVGINSKLSFFRNDKHSLAIVAVCRSID